jgi:hypothetical protein
VNVVTIVARNVAIPGPVSRLFTWMGSPERGSISVKDTPASAADSAHTRTGR